MLYYLIIWVFAFIDQNEHTVIAIFLQFVIASVASALCMAALLWYFYSQYLFMQATLQHF